LGTEINQFGLLMRLCFQRNIRNTWKNYVISKMILPGPYLKDMSCCWCSPFEVMCFLPWMPHSQSISRNAVTFIVII